VAVVASVRTLVMSANSKNANGSTGGGRKKGGGFLSRQAQTKGATEEELLKKDHVMPSDVLRLTRATDSKSTSISLVSVQPWMPLMLPPLTCRHYSANLCGSLVSEATPDGLSLARLCHA